ncbi:MAG: hypothetical protein HOO96_26200 [Polyangiaceae bacterium]|nr:hypothetical protein [Polyangiaceae bacterium]
MKRMAAFLLCASCTQIQNLGFDGTRSSGDGGSASDASSAADAGRDGSASTDAEAPGGPTATLMNVTGASCAISAGSVKCWGSNSSGILASGTSVVDVRGDAPGEMGAALPRALLGTVGSAVALFGGYRSMCARFDDGRLKCWGVNDTGQLGLGDLQNRGNDVAGLGNFLPFVDLGSGRAVTHMDMGRDSACAALDNGAVKCWGRHHGSYPVGIMDEVLGDEPGEMGDALPPVSLGGGRFAVATALGTNFQCVLFRDGDIKCWGQGVYGALGRNDGASGVPGGILGDALDAVPLGSGLRAEAVAAGDSHVCAIVSSATVKGAVKCWGHNDVGQLGLGDVRNRGDQANQMGDALPFVGLGVGRSARAIDAAADRTCVLLDDGNVKCWGSNQGGGLGLGDQKIYGTLPGNSGDALPPVDLGAKASAITMSFDHACARLVGGAIKCWGVAAFLGLGTSDGTLGDAPGEMGAALPVVDVP